MKKKLVSKHFKYISELVKFCNEENLVDDIVSVVASDRFGEGVTLIYKVSNVGWNPDSAPLWMTRKIYNETVKLYNIDGQKNMLKAVKYLWEQAKENGAETFGLKEAKAYFDEYIKQ